MKIERFNINAEIPSAKLEGAKNNWLGWKHVYIISDKEKTSKAVVSLNFFENLFKTHFLNQVFSKPIDSKTLTQQSTKTSNITSKSSDFRSSSVAKTFIPRKVNLAEFKWDEIDTVKIVMKAINSNKKKDKVIDIDEILIFARNDEKSRALDEMVNKGNIYAWTYLRNHKVAIKYKENDESPYPIDEIYTPWRTVAVVNKI